MSQEVERFLALARSFLTKAEGMRQHGWPEEAGRASYLAAFHRAQAVIFHQSGRVAKTHQGVHAEFARIVKGMPGTDRQIWQFLRTGYDMKSMADYGTDPDAMIMDDEAKTAIGDARRFLDQASALLSPRPVDRGKGRMDPRRTE